MSLDSFTRLELDSLAHSASLFEDLLNSGAISMAEHQALLTVRWEDAVTDQLAAKGRNEQARIILNELFNNAQSKSSGTHHEP